MVFFSPTAHTMVRQLRLFNSDSMIGNKPRQCNAMQWVSQK